LADVGAAAQEFAPVGDGSMRLLMLILAGLTGLALAPAPAAAQETGYRLNPGDVVRISVWREEELNREALVQPDGSVSFPLAGQVAAAGRTPGELQADIAQRLDRFIPGAVVTVELLDAKGNVVYVIGEVNRPGAYQVGRDISVVQAISLAGGFTPFAGTSRVRVIRKTAEGETVIPVDYRDIERGRDLAADIPLRAGDTVIVPAGSLFR
jgi:polysaccharide export outer membrane protein